MKSISDLFDSKIKASNKNKFSGLENVNCKDLYQAKDTIEREIRNRIDIKVSNIQKEYAEKKKEIESKFHKIASDMGTELVSIDALSYSDKLSMICTFTSINNMTYNMTSMYVDNCINFYANRFIEFIADRGSIGMILKIAMDVEIEKLDLERDIKIASIKGY